MFKNLFYLLFLLVLTSCSWTKNWTKQRSHSQRIEEFQAVDLHTDDAVEVLWNSYAVPRIQAQSDKDLFYTVGAVQMHLRRFQLEALRMISQGRVSEMIGPWGVDTDHFIRSINFKGLAEKHFLDLSKETRQALLNMARGMNDYIEQSPSRPLDMHLAGLTNKKWSALDLAIIHKFISMDVNWMIYAKLIDLYERPYFSKLWSFFFGQKDFFQRVLEDYGKAIKSKPKSSKPNFSKPKPSQPNSSVLEEKNSNFEALGFLQKNFSKAGSNAFVVGNAKTQTRSAILANDPHLGIMIPNIWMFMVLDSPSYKSMGYFMPSFPVPAVGRNQNIAWGGTNLWGISTYLSKVTAEQLHKSNKRYETIDVRFWFSKKIRIREVQGQPVITDTEMFHHIDPLSLYWVGSEASDEALSFLKINKASNWEQFTKAFETYAVSGQNFLYADKKGHIGKLMAFRQRQLPEAPHLALSSSALSGKDKVFKNYKDLPQIYDPKQNFIVSANDSAKVDRNNPVSLFHAPNDRVHRMRELLSRKKIISLDDVKKIHQDTYSESAFELKQAMVKKLEGFNDFSFLKTSSYKALKNWDGFYKTDSKGALAFEVASTSLVKAYMQTQIGKFEGLAYAQDELLHILTLSTRWRKVLVKALQKDSYFVNLQPWENALNLADERLKTYKNWGRFHRLNLSHPLAKIPFIGDSLFRFSNQAYPGGNETLLKAAHKPSTEPVEVIFGAQARWMTDLSSVNANYFAILGGQDAWLFSENMNDQTPLWMQGRYIHVPFERSEFLKTTDKAAK